MAAIFPIHSIRPALAVTARRRQCRRPQGRPCAPWYRPAATRLEPVLPEALEPRPTGKQTGTPASLGKILMERDLITEEQLSAAIARQKRPGRRLGHVLIDMGFATADAILAALGAQLNVARGAGCKDCRGTGFRGRIGIIEMLEMTKEMKELVLNRAPESALFELAQAQGMRTLREECLARVSSGETTLEEVLRVTHDHR